MQISMNSPSALDITNLQYTDQAHKKEYITLGKLYTTLQINYISSACSYPTDTKIKV